MSAEILYIPSSSSSSSSANVGTATIDFGTYPGSITASVTVTGQATILSTSSVRVWFQGTDSTVDHSDYEHLFAPSYIILSCSSISVGSSFQISAISQVKITGTFKVRWEWI